MNAVRSRRPLFPRWSGAECKHCGKPVEIVVLDVLPGKTERVEIERKAVWQQSEHPTVQRIAVRVIGLGLHGYRVTKTSLLTAGYTPTIPHLAVCEDAPPPPHAQLELEL